MKHICHAIGCKTEVKPTLLTCPKHWALVPVDLRFAVIRNYRKGQCDDKRPSKEWMKAARAAIEAVRAIERSAGKSQP